MKLNIICVGKLQNEFKSLFETYKSKIEFYSQVNVIELKEVNHDNVEVQKQKETEMILASIPKNSKVFLCSLNGKEYSSEKFSELFCEDNITFVIGGSHGVDESFFQNKVKFSNMTFPHQLFRVMLIEQIFRGFSIINNSKYHK